MTTITLDIPHSITLGEFLDIVQKHNLTFRILANHGPASGNPLVEFTGSSTDIDNLLAEIK